jgi:hypothetical protein
MYRGSVALPAYDKALFRDCVLSVACGVTTNRESVMLTRSITPSYWSRGEPTAEDGPLSQRKQGSPWGGETYVEGSSAVSVSGVAKSA